MYKIVASDMDDTFLASDHSVPAANVEAIRRLRELGCLFVPSSGRAYGSIMESLRAVPTELMEGSYVISYNGGCITRVGDDAPLSSHSLPFERVRALFEYGLEQAGLSFHVYELGGKVWTYRLQQDERDYLEGHMGHEELREGSIDFLRDVPLAKILYCLPDGLSELHRILDQMPRELWEGTLPTFSSHRYLEFNPEGVDKGAGLRRLAELLGVGTEQTIGCGDSLNDLAMIRAAGVGVAVANASDGIELEADYHARSTNDDGVIAEVVRELVEPAARS
ncbi:hypothetical protein HMPREF1008_01152 [Olsenella sp. oral taxon 809 str. F0356]|uniref:Cof-type HAD-IIB family hydrolase n=1 Tax=Olsenella sp. oral taxon 809 TaxID=661086 RepID=UPI000231F16B|nr:HAD family hydrolase [Olsenella sp. oral taxon 809]EHF01528.1 hypothetical protein HMPREF1008_01152 [Olsenella sp. oral taxon 809 str. F0356]